MVAGKSGRSELRSFGAGRVMTHFRRLGALAATLTLVACTQTVMVQPADDGSSTQRPVTRSSSSTAPTHTVQPGDTLYKISVQYGVDYRDLAQWNNISAPYTIYPKQSLRVGPDRPIDNPVSGAASTSSIARVTETNTARPATQAAGTAIATPSTSGPAQNAASNTSKPAGYNAELGVTLPPGAHPIGSSPPASAPTFEAVETLPTVAAGSVAASTTTTTTAATATPGTVAALPTAPPPTPATVAPIRSGPVAAEVAGAKPSAAGWIWPTTGKVVGTYAGGDPTRQGVDIAGEIGQPVRAARDGEVVYSGAGLIGYGELVIVKHSADTLSAYGHNRVRLVKEGDKVKSGQKIAEMGKNAANRVLLHFEVRKNGKPVDPLPLLPAR